MRQGQQNRRNRGRGRKGQSPLSRTFESNGPDVKIRGTANHIAEKYMALARDAMSSGDLVMAENYLQHAEHYNRIIMAAQPQFRADEMNGQRPRRPDMEMGGMTDADMAEGYDGDEDLDGEMSAEALGLAEQPRIVERVQAAGGHEGGGEPRNFERRPHRGERHGGHGNYEPREGREPRESREPREGREGREHAAGRDGRGNRRRQRHEGNGGRPQRHAQGGGAAQGTGPQPDLRPAETSAADFGEPQRRDGEGGGNDKKPDGALI
ncbi:MAG: DUF4167 domain-containing protein [Hyphomicrobiaceae bacterium]